VINFKLNVSANTHDKETSLSWVLFFWQLRNRIYMLRNDDYPWSIKTLN